MDCLIDGTTDVIVSFTAISSGIVSVAADHIRVPSKQQITVTSIIKHSCPGDSWCWVTICRTVKRDRTMVTIYHNLVTTETIETRGN